MVGSGARGGLFLMTLLFLARLALSDRGYLSSDIRIVVQARAKALLL